MTRTGLRKAIAQLTDYQIRQLTHEVLAYLNLNETLKNTKPECCPICHNKDAILIKKGVQNGKQRYQCKCCGHKFTFDTAQITSCSHQPLEAWITVIKDTMAFMPLRTTAQHIGVCHETAFNMRHKFLVYLEALLEHREPLEALIELDETYVVESLKGTPVTHRKPRKHGEGSSKRGLSSEQYCVCVGTDRNNHVTAKCVNRAIPTVENLIDALGDHIAAKSVLLTDGGKSYDGLAAHTACQRVTLIGHESYDKVYHLNTVNSLHSRFKDMIRQYRGVASKYLNRYAALFAMVSTFCGKAADESTDAVRRSLATIRLHVTIKSSQSVGLLAL